MIAYYKQTARIPQERDDYGDHSFRHDAVTMYDVYTKKSKRTTVSNFLATFRKEKDAIEFVEKYNNQDRLDHLELIESFVTDLNNLQRQFLNQYNQLNPLITTIKSVQDQLLKCLNEYKEEYHTNLYELNICKFLQFKEYQ